MIHNVLNLFPSTHALPIWTFLNRVALPHSIDMNITNAVKYIPHISNFFLEYKLLPLADYERGMSIAKGNLLFWKMGFKCSLQVILQAWDGLVYPL